MWWPIIIVFSPLFWILCAVEFIWIFWCVEEEHPGRAFMSIILLGALLCFFGDFNVFSWIKDNPDIIASYGMYYVAAGFLWGIVKYFFFLSKIRREYKALKTKYMKTYNLTEMRAEHLNNMHNDYSYKYDMPNTDFINNKARIITWMSYWPISLVWTLLRDFATRIFECIWDWTQAMFKTMHDKILGEILNDENAVKEFKNK